MVTPDQVAAAFPPDEGTQPRWREGVTRFMRELPSAIAESFKPLVAGLQQQVADAIAQLSLTRDQIDQKVANPGAIAPTSVTAAGAISSASTITATGAISAGGSITTSSTGRFDGGLYSTDARNFIVAQNYAASWIDVNGHFGISPSSRRFKQDIEAWHPDVARFFEHVRAVRFHYDVPDQPIGYDEAGEAIIGPHPDPGLGPWQYGFIAEEFVDAGLDMFTFQDADGQVLGINYDRVVVALFDVMRHQQDQIDDHGRRLEALESRAG